MFHSPDDNKLGKLGYLPKSLFALGKQKGSYQCFLEKSWRTYTVTTELMYHCQHESLSSLVVEVSFFF